MGKWKCSVCGYIYDEAKEGIPFADLPEDWTCPQCGAPKSAFNQIEGGGPAGPTRPGTGTVAEKIVEQLVAYGVKRVYGIPGSSNLPLADAIRKNPGIELVLARHEGGAAFMASGHAKLTGELGVCMSIAGPGATNLITGLVDAASDRAPVLALLGQVPEVFLGSESLQEIAETDIFSTFCVSADLISNPAHALAVTNLAVKRAYAAPGPVALSLPTDVLRRPLEESIWRPEEHLFGPDTVPADEVIGRAADLIARSKRPLLFAGWGARHCGPELLDLARHLGAPIATTSRAKGVVNEADELVLGVLGSIGNRFAPRLVAKSDLMVIFGTGFRQRNLVPNTHVIQVDIDPTRVGKTFPVKVGIVGSTREVLEKLRAATAPRRIDPEFKAAVDRARSDFASIIAADERNDRKPIYPGRVIQALKKNAARDALFCVDVGDHTYWFYKRFVCEGHRTLLCANMAGMGFGLPAAIACQFEQPERQVIAVTGDGGFGMCGMEFTTAVCNDLPLTVVVFNDAKLKNIMKEQRDEGFEEYRVSFPNPNFAEFATSAGGLGIRVEEAGELDAALRRALDSKAPALVEVMVDPAQVIKKVRRA